MLDTENSGSSLLWEVTGNELSHPSYFLGTMHLMCAEDALLSNASKEVIASVAQVYLEIDLAGLADLVNSGVDIRMNDGVNLSQLLGEDEYEKVKLFFEVHQPYYPFSYLEVQQPLMLSSSLYELFLPCNNKIGIDSLVAEEANKLGKEMKGLESLSFQSEILNSIPYNQQAKELLKTIDNIEKYQDYFKEMISLYKAQNIERLHDMTTKEEAGIADFTNLLLYERNRNWVKQFALIAKEKPALFAVGAGHLGGEEGVLNLLKQSGYILRPLIN